MSQLQINDFSSEVNRILSAADTDVLSRKIRAAITIIAEKLQSYLLAKESEIAETDELQTNLPEKTAADVIGGIINELESNGKATKHQQSHMPEKTAAHVISGIIGDLTDDKAAKNQQSHLPEKTAAGVVVGIIDKLGSDGKATKNQQSHLPEKTAAGVVAGIIGEVGIDGKAEKTAAGVIAGVIGELGSDGKAAKNQQSGLPEKTAAGVIAGVIGNLESDGKGEKHQQNHLSEKTAAGVVAGIVGEVGIDGKAEKTAAGVIAGVIGELDSDGKAAKNQLSGLPEKNAVGVIVSIIGNLGSDISSEEIPETADILQVYLTKDELIAAIAEVLKELKENCDESITHRVFAYEKNIQEYVLKILEKYPDEINITFPGLEALISMTKDQPYILNSQGIFIMLQYLDIQIIAATKQQILQWLHVCMDHCEKNRVSLYRRGILTRLEVLMDEDTTMSPTISDVCLVIRALVDYDNTPDIFKYVLDRITAIAKRSLPRLVKLLHKFIRNESLIKDLLFTIRKLLVTNDLCKALLYKDRGMLYVQDVFAYHLYAEEISCEVLKMFYVMIGNKTIKTIMLDVGAINIIKKALDNHLGSEFVTEAAFECIAKATLKRPKYVKRFKDAGIPKTIVAGMETHIASYDIQKLGSWIIRIFLTYERNLCNLFLKLGTVNLLLKAIATHKSTCEYDAKAALRDLGYNVDITEPINTLNANIADNDFLL